MAGNVSGIHRFADDVGPEPLKWLDDSYDTLTIALNTLATFSNFYPDTGTTNALTVHATQYQFVSLTDGLQITARVAATNTGAATLNVNGLGAMPILNANGSPLVPGQMLAGSLITFIYNAARNAWQITAGSSSAVLTEPLVVTTPDGAPLLDVSSNGTSARAPLFATDETGAPLFTVNMPPHVDQTGACLVEIGPGSHHTDAGTILCLDGAVGHQVLQVYGALQTQPNIYVANFVAGCATGFSNGVWIAAGTNASDHAFIVENCASASDPPNKQQFFALNGDGSGTLGPEPNQLKWNAAGQFTLTGSATLPMPPLVDLPGINITNPQNGQALVYENGNWVNETPANQIATLTDVALANLANGQSLIWNSTAQKWNNSTPVTALPNLSDVHLTASAPGQVLTYSISPTPGWINATLPAYSFLTKVSVQANPNVGQVLTWDGSGWIGADPGQVTIIPLSGLSDVAISSPLNRQVLTWDAPNNHWINAPVPSPSLATLPDVSLTSQTQGQVLAWNSTTNRWVNSALPGGEVIALSSLMDTNISNPQDKQVLEWDYASERWVNSTLPISPVISNPAAGQVIGYNGTSWVNTTLPAPALHTLTDVNVSVTPPPSDSQLLLYNGGTGKWIASNVINAFTSVSPRFDVHDAQGAKILDVNDLGVGPYGVMCSPGTAGTLPAGYITLVANAPQNVPNGTAMLVSTEVGSQGLVVRGAPAPSLGNAVFNIVDRTWTENFARIDGQGVGYIGAGGGKLFQWDANGNFSVGYGQLAVYGQLNQNYPFKVLAQTNAPNVWLAQLWIYAPTAVWGNCNGLSLQIGSTAADWAIMTINVPGYTIFNVRGDGALLTPYLMHASATNDPVSIDPNGWVMRGSSSRRYKTNIRDMRKERAREIIRKLRPVTFTSLCEMDDPTRECYGLIAEEVAEIDPALTAFDKEGRPSSVDYGRVALMLLPLVRELLEERDHG